MSIRSSAFRVECPEEQTDEKEDKGEADTHKGQSLHDKVVLLLID